MSLIIYLFDWIRLKFLRKKISKRWINFLIILYEEVGKKKKHMQKVKSVKIFRFFSCMWMKCLWMHRLMVYYICDWLQLINTYNETVTFCVSLNVLKKGADNLKSCCIVWSGFHHRIGNFQGTFACIFYAIWLRFSKSTV